MDDVRAGHIITESYPQVDNTPVTIDPFLVDNLVLAKAEVGFPTRRIL